MTDPRHPITKKVPATFNWVPSRINTWRGNWSEESRFTGFQRRMMQVLELDEETIETVLVSHSATNAEEWIPEYGKHTLYHFECPVLGHRRDGRILIMAPSGEAKLVAYGRPPRSKQPLVQRIEPAVAEDVRHPTERAS